MSDSATPPPSPTPGRRTVRFDTVEAVLADVDRLRRGGYRQVGKWTLPQVCHHLADTVGGNLVPPPTDDQPTAEQLAMKAKFFGMVLGGLVEGLPLAPEKIPSANCCDADIDALGAAFEKFAAYPHPKLMVGRCGPVPVGEVLQIHLGHAAHHLSFLTPTTVRRAIRYRSIDELIADVQLLRRGYIRSGNWTLAQTCWHLRTAAQLAAAAPITEASPDQLRTRPGLEAILGGAPLPDGLRAPVPVQPPATAGEADIDTFIAFQTDRKLHPPGTTMHRLFGPITGEQVAALSLIHAAHHLSYLVPT